MVLITSMGLLHASTCCSRNQSILKLMAGSRMSGKARHGERARLIAGFVLVTIVPDGQINFVSDVVMSSPPAKNIPLSASGKSMLFLRASHGR